MSSLGSLPRLFSSSDLHYHVDDDFLGSGAFGEVYRCRLPVTGEVVAVKILYSPRRLRDR